MVEQEKLDNLMLELDGTENKCKQALGWTRTAQRAEGAGLWTQCQRASSSLPQSRCGGWV